MVVLGAAAAAVTLAASPAGRPPLAASDLPVLGAFLALLILAEYLFVRFRYGGEINSLNLIEAVIAPLIVAFATPVAVAVVAIAQVLGAVLRRNAPLKLSLIHI